MNKPNMFVVTSACDSNLRYSLEDKKKCSYLVHQNYPFTSWNLRQENLSSPAPFNCLIDGYGKVGTGGRSCVC